MRGWIESIQVWGRTLYKGKQEYRQFIGGGDRLRHYMTRGQTVNKGGRTAYNKRSHLAYVFFHQLLFLIFGFARLLFK